MTVPSELLADSARCAGLLPGYAPRQAQLEMADRVDATLASGDMLVLEAGTGIGKTLAYLLPILLGGYRAIVSTGTKALQAQIFDKDLPLARRIAGTDTEVALLKGRSNYLCLHRLAGAEGDRALSMDMLADLVRIREWSPVTLTGDRMDIESVDEDASIWPFVTSTTDNCLGQRCAFYDECFVFKARRAAATAGVVVVNHHLLMAELVLRDDGYGEILPTADVCIVDEAHQFPDVAAMFLGQHLSSRQLSDLVRDARVADAREAGDMPDLDSRIAALERAGREFRLALGDGGRREFAPDAAGTPLRDALAGLDAALEQGAAALAAVRERGPELANAAQRAAQLRERLEAFTRGDDPDHVRWTEAGRLGFMLHATPVDPGAGFAARRTQLATSWVFTSATIAVGGSFAYFRDRLALDDCSEACWDSPFDYPRNALAYFPDLPAEPNQPAYTGAVVDAALPVLRASAGRAFVLFTSYRALREAAERLRARHAGEFEFLVQGDRSRPELLRRFESTPRAVLLGTASFWEGIDVRGPDLSCVVIDKLPFAQPDDPVLKARLARIAERGGNAFMELQVPEAVLMLKQGAGRLIRDVDDRGVLMVCDPRLARRSYGRIFLKALPPMRRTSALEEVQAFFASDSQAGVA